MTSLDKVSQASVAPLKLDHSMMGKTLLTPLSSLIIQHNKYFTLSTWVGIFGLLFMFASCSKNKELERDKQLIADYIAEKNIQGVITTNSGLSYKITKEGNGDNPTANSNVSVNYKGYLLDGSVFDESTTPISFNLQQVIQGWREGIPKFREGGSGILFIPADYGYGSQSKPGIPANSILIFEIDLLEIL